MLVAGVIPGGLARGEVEIVDFSCHVLAAGEEEGGEEEGGGHFSTSEKTQEREGDMMGGSEGERREVALSPVTER